MSQVRDVQAPLGLGIEEPVTVWALLSERGGPVSTCNFGPSLVIASRSVHDIWKAVMLELPEKGWLRNCRPVEESVEELLLRCKTSVGVVLIDSNLEEIRRFYVR